VIKRRNSQVEEFSNCDKIIPNKKGHVIPVKTGIQFINNSTQINADWADFRRLRILFTQVSQEIKKEVISTPA